MSVGQIVAPEVEHGDVDVPETAVIHTRFADPADGIEWNVLPGTAFCGFVFTTENSLGDPFNLPANVVKRRCSDCAAVSAFMHRMVGQ